MREYKPHLDEIVDATHKSEHSGLMQSLWPSFKEYDPHKHAKELAQDFRLKKIGIGIDEITHVLAEASLQYTDLMEIAKDADMSDKYKRPARKAGAAAISAAIATTGVGAPFAPFIAAGLYLVIELYEWKHKVQVMRELATDPLPQNRAYSRELRRWELASFIPYVGTVLDFMNKYVDTVERSITNYGRHQLYKKYDAEIRAAFEGSTDKRKYPTIDIRPDPPTSITGA